MQWLCNDYSHLNVTLSFTNWRTYTLHAHTHTCTMRHDITWILSFFNRARYKITEGWQRIFWCSLIAVEMNAKKKEEVDEESRLYSTKNGRWNVCASFVFIMWFRIEFNFALFLCYSRLRHDWKVLDGKLMENKIDTQNVNWWAANNNIGQKAVRLRRSALVLFSLLSNAQVIV